MLIRTNLCGATFQEDGVFGLIDVLISRACKAAIGIVLVACASCTEINYAGTHYSDISPVKFQYAGKTWRVFDKPSEGRLMITPSLGDAAAAGAIEGLTFGLSGNASGPEGAFHSASAAFLEQRSGSCRITNGALIIDPQWEFFYSCQ